MNDEGISLKDYLKSEMVKDEKLLTELNQDKCKVCTVSKGKHRQELYGCKTCSENEGFAYCMACFLECHADHETFEIGIKRNSICECKMNEKEKCLLISSNSLDSNEIQSETNLRDHNYFGKFCICDKEYDPNTFMISCLSCQDFYHPHHIGLGIDETLKVTNNEDYGIMICPNCLNEEFLFLRNYTNVQEVVYNVTNDEIINLQQKTENNLIMNKNDEKCELSNTIFTTRAEKPLFLNENWIQHLCNCKLCEVLISNSKVKMVIKEYQTTIESENEEIKIDESFPQLKTLYSKAEGEFKNLNHETQCNLANGFKNLSEKLNSFFNQFLDSNKTITIDDVQEFIKTLPGKKVKLN